MEMTYLKKIDRSSVVQSIIDVLTQAIIDGELKPGDRIPTEMELSEQLGVARNSVREAVKILVYIGVLEIRRSEGTFVTDGFTESLIDPMIYGIILNQHNERELNELRAMIESGVLRLAIQKCSDEQVEELHQRLLDLEEAILKKDADPDTVFEYDNAFHQTITAMGDNAMVTKINNIVSLLTNSVRRNSVELMLESGRNEELYRAHERVYDLVASRKTSGLYNSIRATYFIDGESADEVELV